MSSPLTQLSLQPCSAAQLRINIKEEPKCSTPTPCQFTLKKHCQVSSTAPTTATTTPVMTMDKDKMLQEKDKQIEELTRMLRQKQRLVEVLRMQLEHGKRGGRVPEPLILVKVKQEPPDMSSVPLSLGHLPLSRPPSSCEMDVSTVTVKQEAVEAEEVVSKTTHGLLQTQQAQIKSEQKSTQKKQQHICLQQSSLQFTQGQAIQKLLLQQQRNIQSHSQTLVRQNLQDLSQQRKRKSHKQQLKQQEQQLKQPVLLNQQKSFLQQQNKQQHQTKQQQQIQIHTKIHLKQQQVLIQQKQQVRQQAPQVSNWFYSIIYNT